MGIYAPNVDVPKNCCVCGFSRTANYRKKDIENGFRAIGGRMCSITGNVMPMYCSYRTRMRECPLIGVAEPHGRLVDVDSLELCNYDLDPYPSFMAVPEETLEDADTIIPAEGK